MKGGRCSWHWLHCGEVRQKKAVRFFAHPPSLVSGVLLNWAIPETGGVWPHVAGGAVLGVQSCCPSPGAVRAGYSSPQTALPPSPQIYANKIAVVSIFTLPFLLTSLRAFVCSPTTECNTHFVACAVDWQGLEGGWEWNVIYRLANGAHVEDQCWGSSYHT